MSRLVIINGVHQGRAFRLKPGLSRIGRSVENHFQIPDPSVSAAHCEIIYSESELAVHDLGSTNGTYINGEQITDGTIRLSQILQLGNVELRLEEMADEGEAMIAVPALPVDQVPVSVLLPDGSRACANHPELPGTFLCTHCQQALCESCVRVIRRITKDQIVFCSLCNGVCDSLAPAAPLLRGKSTLLGRLAKTLKMTFKS